MLYTPLLAEAASGHARAATRRRPLRTMGPTADWSSGARSSSTWTRTTVKFESDGGVSGGLRGPGGGARRRLAHAADPRARRARARLQVTRGRDPAPQPRPAPARGRCRTPPRAAPRAQLRFRRRRLRGRGGTRRARRSRPRRPPLLPEPPAEGRSTGCWSTPAPRSAGVPSGSSDCGRASWRVAASRSNDTTTEGSSPTRRPVRRRPHRPLTRSSGPGSRVDPLPAASGLPVDARGASWSARRCRSRGTRAWAPRRRARVQPRAPGGRPADGSTRSARRDSSSRTSRPSRSLTATACWARSQRSAATGGSPRFGERLRGFPGWLVTRTYHLFQLPLVSRKLRVVVDWTVALFFRRDIASLGGWGIRGGSDGAKPHEQGSPSPRGGAIGGCEPVMRGTYSRAPSRCGVARAVLPAAWSTSSRPRRSPGDARNFFVGAAPARQPPPRWR